MLALLRHVDLQRKKSCSAVLIASGCDDFTGNFLGCGEGSWRGPMHVTTSGKRAPCQAHGADANQCALCFPFTVLVRFHILRLPAPLQPVM